MTLRPFSENKWPGEGRGPARAPYFSRDTAAREPISELKTRRSLRTILEIWAIQVLVGGSAKGEPDFVSANRVR